MPVSPRRIEVKIARERALHRVNLRYAPPAEPVRQGGSLKTIPVPEHVAERDSCVLEHVSGH
jgi:hypothetical protein